MNDERIVESQKPHESHMIVMGSLLGGAGVTQTPYGQIVESGYRVAENTLNL